jgi:hypothetical protein
MPMRASAWLFGAANQETSAGVTVRTPPSDDQENPLPKERPQIVVIRQGGDHGCLITILLLIIAWPLAILYWLLRLAIWFVGTLFDWLTLGPLRRRGR